jgi:hypothetical protein
MKVKELQSFKSLKLPTQKYTILSQDLELQLQCCENLKSSINILKFWYLKITALLMVFYSTQTITP